MSTMNVIVGALAAVTLAALPATAFAGGFEITRHTIDCGGGTSAGGSFVLTGTIGQHDAAGASNGGDFTVNGGFWAGPPAPAFCAADLMGPEGLGAPDGNVDALDFLVLVAQWGSPCIGTCEADFTGPTPFVPDGNVDALDFLSLFAQWGSPGVCP